MEKKFIYLELEKQRKNFIGIDLGLKYLEFLIVNLKKNNLNLTNDFRVYDFIKDDYFYVDSKGLNDSVQRLYLQFVQIHRVQKNAIFLLLFDSLVEKFGKNQNEILILMLNVAIVFLKNSVDLDARFVEKKFVKNFSEGLDSIFSPENNFWHEKIAKKFLDIFAELGFITRGLFYATIVDKSFLVFIRYLNLNMVNIQIIDQNIIKYSSNFILNNLLTTMNMYLLQRDFSKIEKLVESLYVTRTKEYDILKNHNNNFFNLNFVPSGIVFDNNDDLMCIILEKIFITKFVINEYCFNVLAASCFDNYFFSKDKQNNILLQKDDVRLNLNVYFDEIWL